MEETIEIPEGFKVEMDGMDLSLTKDDDSLKKRFNSPLVDIDVTDESVVLTTNGEDRKSKAMIGTYRSHIKNMIQGLQEGYTYKLQTVYAHFPMNVKVSGNKVIIQNFIGERSSREIKIIDGVSVSVNDDEVTVTGNDKEKVSQTAAMIEQKCKKGKRDPRVFQDGIYLTKGGGEA